MPGLWAATGEMDDMLDRLEASLVAVLEPLGRSAEVAASPA
jgi:hypothetical protein